ncbi:MAG: hypothetical protein ACRDIC_19010 [bacterium]
MAGDRGGGVAGFVSATALVGAPSLGATLIAASAPSPAVGTVAGAAGGSRYSRQ